MAIDDTAERSDAADYICDQVECRYFNQSHPPGKSHVFICKDTQCKKFGSHHVGESPHVY